MTTRALHYLNNQVNSLDTGSQGLEIPNLYLWLRDHITISVSNALYGAFDPFQKNPSLIQALWDFEGDFIRLLPGNLLGKLLAPKAFYGRRRVQVSMIDFYRANSELNDDVIPFIRQTTARGRNLSGGDRQDGNEFYVCGNNRLWTDDFLVIRQRTSGQRVSGGD